MRFNRWVGLSVLVLVACGDSDKDEARPTSATLTGTTACERWASLATAVGCTPLANCNLTAECNDATIPWIDCAARDLSQCKCETDGGLNCEGSFKSNEGPARCISEANALQAPCED